MLFFFVRLAFWLHTPVECLSCRKSCISAVAKKLKSLACKSQILMVHSVDINTMLFNSAVHDDDCFLGNVEIGNTKLLHICS